MNDAFDIADQAFQLAKQRRYSEALALCDKIIASWPHAYIGHYRKANVLRMSGNAKIALNHLSRVVQLLPESAFPYLARAELLMEFGKYEQAIEDLSKAKKLDKGYFGPVIPLLRAECHLLIGSFEKARADCDEVPDDFIYPSFRGLRDGSKHHVLRDIEAAGR